MATTTAKGPAPRARAPRKGAANGDGAGAKVAKVAKVAKKGTRKRRGVTLEPATLPASDVPLAETPPELEPIVAAIRDVGGAVIGAYREPLGGHPMIFAALPVDRIEPTPFQRDASDAHVRKLTVAMDKTRRFLDPVIATLEGDRFWTPNGNHRLTALKELGATSIIALVVPDRRVAYQILALNIEKAHNLRERAIEVVRMVRDLARFDDRLESECTLELEEPLLVTLGFAYERRPRLSGGAYAPVLKRVDSWIEEPLARAAEERERRAGLVLDLDDAVGEAVAKLKARGLQSPYLRTFVVARINPLRFMKGDPPPMDELLPAMAKRARGMKVEGVKVEDLARSGGAPEED